MSRIATLLLALLAALALTAGPAAARDSHAPAGARGDWLPSDVWVMSSWLPYDEARLESLLHVTRQDLDAWLDDHRSLGELAARHGHPDRRRLAALLVAPRAADHRGTPLATLRARALDTLTQPHLARHLLFHVYHSHQLPRHARQVFGVSTAGYLRLRDRGRTPRRIAAAGGLSVRSLHGRLHAFFADRARRGVAAGAISPREARDLLAVQDAGLDAYIDRSYRTSAQQACYAGQHHHDGGHDSRECPGTGGQMDMS